MGDISAVRAGGIGPSLQGFLILVILRKLLVDHRDFWRRQTLTGQHLCPLIAPLSGSDVVTVTGWYDEETCNVIFTMCMMMMLIFNSELSLVLTLTCGLSKLADH